MAVVKAIVGALMGLAALGLVGLGAVSGDGLRTASAPALTAGPVVSLRSFPEGAGAFTSVKAPDRPDTPVKPPDRPDVPDTPEVEDAGTPPPADAGAPPEKPDAGAPATKPDAGSSPPDAGTTPRPKPDAGTGPPVPPGQLNLRASDTADVFVDGRKVGSSPVLGFKVKPGNHRVRFDCYDSAGNAITGQVQTLSVGSDKEADLDYACPQ
jgi:hypothetical protein